MPKVRLSAPIFEILRAYWQSDRGPLVLVTAMVPLSGIAAPDRFSRPIDQLGSGAVAKSLVLAFLAYYLLMRLAAALQRTRAVFA